MRKLQIVPIDVIAHPAHKANANFDVNLVPTRSTSVDLVQQLVKLCCAASDVPLQQPSPQHIGLASKAELLQGSQLRRHTCVLQIDQSHVIQNCLRLCGMTRTAARHMGRTAHRCQGFPDAGRSNICQSPCTRGLCRDRV